MAALLDSYDVIIVGTGVAGLNCALNLPPEKKILIICKKSPEESDSYLAQGGICMLRGDDDYQSFFDDTMRAGHYENNPAAVACMIKGSRQIIDDLISFGVDFAREADGSLAFTKEGGHSAPRICYHEDCTGEEITIKLMQATKKLENVTMVFNMVMLDIIEYGGECRGVVMYDKGEGKLHTVLADYTVLATGGVGGAFGNTTNFSALTGDALAISMRHGIAVDNINYIQVHPTSLYTKKKGRRFLISESVRGEGAHLLGKDMQRFTDELQPRDVVTKAVREQMAKDGTEYVWLDLRPIPKEELDTHFIQIVKRCAEEGYDVYTECIPVAPAVHYFMGGIRSDLNGRTTMPRLYAIGETCCNGVHGKNRLASNSLLESLVFAKRAAYDIGKGYKAAAGGKEALDGIDRELYSNPAELLKAYKKDVQEAVAMADRGEDVNKLFKEKRI